MATPQEQQMLEAYIKYAKKKGVPPTRQGWGAFARKYVQSTPTTGSVGPANTMGGYTVQPNSMSMMSASYDSSPMAPKVYGIYGSGASDYFKYIEGLQREQAKARAAAEKEYRDSIVAEDESGKKSKAAYRKEVMANAEDIRKQIDSGLAETPDNWDADTEQAKKMTAKEKNDWVVQQALGRVSAFDAQLGRQPQTGSVRRAIAESVLKQFNKDDKKGKKTEKYGGGTIEVTGEARPGDAKKGTIAITGGNPDNPKQWIFEPTDDGNYIAKRPKPGKFNTWETGKVVSPGDLYDMTKGEFGKKGPSYGSSDPGMMDGMDTVDAQPTETKPDPQPQEAGASGYGPVSGKIQYPENYDVGGYVPEKTLAPTPQEPVREPYTGYEGKGFGDVGRLAQDVYGSASEGLNSAKDAWNSDWGARRGLTPEGFSDAPDYEPELASEDEELMRQMEEERMMEERMKWAEAQSWQDKRLSPDNYNMDEGGDYGWY